MSEAGPSRVLRRAGRVDRHEATPSQRVPVGMHLGGSALAVQMIAWLRAVVYHMAAVRGKRLDRFWP